MYDKPFLDYAELIRYLDKKYGLIINDVPFAIHALKTYSYYDLVNGYKDYMMVDGRFKPGTTIEQLCNFYLFDGEFKNILFTKIMMIENHFKMALSYQISKDISVSEKDYLKPLYYVKKKKPINATMLLSKIQEIYQPVSPKTFIPQPTAYYKDCHNHIPPWILFKNISFSNAINLFRILKPAQKYPVAREMLPSGKITDPQRIDYLISGLNLIRNCRNKIAHNLKFITFSADNKESLKESSLRALLPVELTKKSSSYTLSTFNGIYAAILFIYSISSDNILRKNLCADLLNLIQKTPRIYSDYAKATNLPTDMEHRLSSLYNTLDHKKILLN